MFKFSPKGSMRRVVARGTAAVLLLLVVAANCAAADSGREGVSQPRRDNVAGSVAAHDPCMPFAREVSHEGQRSTQTLHARHRMQAAVSPVLKNSNKVRMTSPKSTW